MNIILDVSFSVSVSLNWLAWINDSWESPKGGWYLSEILPPHFISLQITFGHIYRVLRHSLIYQRNFQEWNNLQTDTWTELTDSVTPVEQLKPTEEPDYRCPKLLESGINCPSSPTWGLWTRLFLWGLCERQTHLSLSDLLLCGFKQGRTSNIASTKKNIFLL